MGRSLSLLIDNVIVNIAQHRSVVGVKKLFSSRL